MFVLEKNIPRLFVAVEEVLSCNQNKPERLRDTRSQSSNMNNPLMR